MFLSRLQTVVNTKCGAQNSLDALSRARVIHGTTGCASGPFSWLNARSRDNVYVRTDRKYQKECWLRLT